MHMPRAVPVHTDGHDWPSPWEAKGGLCGFGAGAGSSKSGLQGDMNLRITTNPVLRERERKKSCCHTFFCFRPYFSPSCLHSYLTTDAQKQ